MRVYVLKDILMSVHQIPTKTICIGLRYTNMVGHVFKLLGLLDAERLHCRKRLPCI